MTVYDLRDALTELRDNGLGDAVVLENYSRQEAEELEVGYLVSVYNSFTKKYEDEYFDEGEFQAWFIDKEYHTDWQLKGKAVIIR